MRLVAELGSRDMQAGVALMGEQTGRQREATAGGRLRLSDTASAAVCPHVLPGAVRYSQMPGMAAPLNRAAPPLPPLPQVLYVSFCLQYAQLRSANNAVKAFALQQVRGGGRAGYKACWAAGRPRLVEICHAHS